MLFNGSFAFFQFLVNLPCYSIGISYFFYFSSILHVIQWEVYAFYQLMLFNGNLRLEKLRGGTNSRTDGWTDACKSTPVSHRTSTLWGHCPKREEKKGKNSRKSVTWSVVPNAPMLVYVRMRRREGQQTRRGQ